MKNAEWLLKQGIEFDDIYLTAPANYTYVIEDKTGKKLGCVDNSYDELSAFKKWLDQEHKEPILDEAERRYLSAVIRPFRDRVMAITKVNDIESDYIIIFMDSNENICLPDFQTGTMYKGMKKGHDYTPEELGL